ncbi:CHAP domain-containing protein [Nonomuraea sp. NPDC047897]|uniref:CHAP domain-containing protein n=1 Tax=Nonomuraea sp. NPDC047897 TaxID=3364346 RepID=UPI0037131C27
MTPETQKFIDLLESQLGYAEKAGAYTKFGAWYGKNVEFDADYTGAPWCDMFLAWAANKLGYEEWMGEFAWTVSHAKWFRKNDAWGTEPEVGAFVFFDWSGTNDLDRIDHVGVVTKVVGRKIHTIEGNIDGGVAKRKVRDTDKVVGYGYPARIKERLDEQLAKQQAIENAHREQLSQPPGQQVNQLQNGPLSSLIPSTEVHVEVQPPLASRKEAAPRTGDQARQEGAPSAAHAKPGAQTRADGRTEAQAGPRAEAPRTSATGRTEKKGKHAKPATADTTAVTAEPLPPTVEAARPITSTSLDSPTLVGSALVAALALLAIAKTRQLRTRPALAGTATAATKATPAARRHRHRRKARALFAAASGGTPATVPGRPAELPTPEAPETVTVPAGFPAELPIAARLAVGAGAEGPLESFEPIVIPRTPAAGSSGPRFRPFEPVALRLPTPSAGALTPSGADPLTARLAAPSEPLAARHTAPSGAVAAGRASAPTGGRPAPPFGPITIPEATSAFDAFAPPAGRAATARRAAGDRRPATEYARGRDSWDAFERPARPSRRHDAGYAAQARATRPEGAGGGYRGRRRRSGHPVEEPAAFTADAPLRGRRHRVTAPHCPDQQRHDPHGPDSARPGQRRLDAPWAEYRLDGSPRRGGDGGGAAQQDRTAFAAWDGPARGRRHARGADGPADGPFFQDTPSRGRRHRASRPAEGSTPAPATVTAFTPAESTVTAFTAAESVPEGWSPTTTGAFAAVTFPAPTAADTSDLPGPGVPVPGPGPARLAASASTASATIAAAREGRTGARRGRHRA